MKKNILGLDLGTTSIGWAYVKESDNTEKSEIVKLGVRIIQYDTFNKVDKSGKISESKNPKEDFASGKGLSPNAKRTQQRGARRNLQRYKQRREKLIKAFIEIGLITCENALNESGTNSTHGTYALRSKAVTEKIEKHELARVLLMINKKRGYKSSRKTVVEEDGQAIDGMDVAKALFDNNITPGEYVYQLLNSAKKYIPDFYRSDLQNEFDRIWEAQKGFYPEILTDKLKENLQGKNKSQSWAICKEPFEIVGILQKGTATEKRLEKYNWRALGLTEKLELEHLAIVLQEINSQINQSSGYLGAISDRSKELIFEELTIGQYLYNQLKENAHNRLKNQVFYRQDYLDEFEAIWDKQAQFYPELDEERKRVIRDKIIFYQRKLKSQKGLISFCELESNEIEVVIDGNTKKKRTGSRVIPKSSPLFQEFKIWQTLNDIQVKNKETGEVIKLELEQKQLLFEALNIKESIKKQDLLKILFRNYKELDFNFKQDAIDGNKTNARFYKAYEKIVNLSGHDDKEFAKLNVTEKNKMLGEIFKELGIDTSLLRFDANSDMETQSYFQLWHLLYSYEGDNSNTGTKKLIQKLKNKFGFDTEYSRLISNISYTNDYGSYSAKAIKKILPHLKDGIPLSGDSKNKNAPNAKEKAGYKGFSSLTKEESENRVLEDRLELLPKNSLRNPVVEKILNQMINVINEILDNPYVEKPDEIRIELARELKKSSKEREDMTKGINKSKGEHEAIKKILIEEFKIKNPTRNDVIRYKLYEELNTNGYKSLYSNKKINRQELFTKKYDIEHIIPKARLFDDSFSNKTITERDVNLKKSDETAYDFIGNEYDEAHLEQYLSRIEKLYNDKIISRGKYNKLKMKGSEIPDGFIDRDLRDSQYIAKKAKEMLEKVFKTVNTTTGTITSKLREDWGLVNVMQELNMDKYRQLGLTEMVEKKDGTFKERIKDWSKRNDHRHHAMDALTVAFTKHSHVQYFNHLNAKGDEKSKVYGIMNKETYKDKNDYNKRKFNLPIGNFREEAKKHLESLLISIKAKNKVVTKNINRVNNGGKPITMLTPRGQLHKETIYRKIKLPISKKLKIGSKFDKATIMKVGKEVYKNALLQRLSENDNDPKKAFAGKNSPAKKPIYIDESHTSKVPEFVKITEDMVVYTIKKAVSPELKLEKVIDKGTRDILQARLDKYGNAKKAFSNLEKDPIWLDQEKGIAIKSVTITGVSNAEPLHYKKDHFGNEILDENGNKIDMDFVSTGNNHHVAIYKDEKGELQENAVSFFEVVLRVNEKLPIIDKGYNSDKNWEFLFTMKQNEMFVFPNKKTGFNPSEINLMDANNYSLISPNLFRVQSISIKDYRFRHHLETSVENSKKELDNIAYKRYRTPANLLGLIKVRINHVGEIVQIGEY